MHGWTLYASEDMQGLAGGSVGGVRVWPRRAKSPRKRELGKVQSCKYAAARLHPTLPESCSIYFTTHLPSVFHQLHPVSHMLHPSFIPSMFHPSSINSQSVVHPFCISISSHLPSILHSFHHFQSLLFSSIFTCIICINGLDADDAGDAGDAVQKVRLKSSKTE